MELLIGHLTGDYLLQNDWMGVNKSKPGVINFLICLLHSLIWTGCICLFCYKRLFVGAGLMITFKISLLWLQHFILDRYRELVKWYMNLMGNFKWVKEPARSYIAFGYDNVFHLLFAWIIIYIL